MNARINHQIIEKDGVPMFALLPYDKYLRAHQSLFSLSHTSGKISPLSYAILQKIHPAGLSKSLLCGWMSRRIAGKR